MAVNKELDPRQIKFLEYYLDVKSDVFGNALQSGLKAGFSQEYSENITTLMPAWLSENIGNSKLLLKAQKNLNELLDEDDTRIKADITKFIASTVGKKTFSTQHNVEQNLNIKELPKTLQIISNKDGDTNNKTDNKTGVSVG